MLRIAILAAGLLLPAAPLLSQTVQGRILEHSSDAPVRGVMVELRTDRGQPLGNSVTDSTGTFSFQLPGEGTYRLLGTRIGYQRVETPGFEVAAGEALEVDVHISTRAVLMTPLTITSRPEPARSRYLEMVGFYERERRSPGTFVRRDRVERSNAPGLSNLLSELPGVRRTVVRGIPMISLNRQRTCPPQVVLDGQPLLEYTRIDEIVHVRAVEAVEIYRGPSETPAEYAYRERGCGMVVIWTRDRV